MTDPVTLILGDCLERMKELPDASVDAVVTDPPYGIRFMGKAWDGAEIEAQMRADQARRVVPDDGGRRTKSAFGNEAGYAGAYRFDLSGNQAFQAWCTEWAREAFRVAKPGAFLLAFGGTRTYHRLASAIEDAGWEIRDCLVWAYASGFPKSLNLPGGLGTALKPAWEPIVMARKPLRGTVAQNVQKYGTGALNIDGTRIGFASDADRAATEAEMSGPRSRNRITTPDKLFPVPANGGVSTHPAGRWPANLLLQDAELFDELNPGVVGSGQVTTTPEPYVQQTEIRGEVYGLGSLNDKAGKLSTHHGDTGGYSRFYLIPKSSRSDREPLLDDRVYCTCETVKPAWVSEAPRPQGRTGSTSPARVTSEATSEDGFAWPTTTNGNDTSDPSHQGNRSTTSMATSRTTESRTSSPSIPSPTSDSTPAASSSTASGGSGAQSAGSTASSPTSGGTSPRKAGRSTDGADPATSSGSSKTSVCETCGGLKPNGSALGGADGVTRAARRNSHPT